MDTGVLKGRARNMGVWRAPHKLVRKRLLVQEDPWVTVLVIEPILHLAHGPHGVIDVRVACEHEERRVGEVALRWRCDGIGAYLGSLITFGIYRGNIILKACVGRYQGRDGVDGIVGVW
jgi:hypothetical protein